MQNPIEVYDFRVLKAWDQGLRVNVKVEGSKSLKVFQGVRFFLGLRFT